ncbi:MAG: MerR family transcriptional regulator [Deltaproteobacteria bacterium HGW-Deltaproteobacteria-6]|nr:MAG: MerR family transcriptional regulator [Deltaproteobacteria bacterium HGW-Deltaproteobacteria-6]
MTIGQLAKSFGLSRSTLLYYDSIGLLKPSARSRTNYRRYTKEDALKLEMICMYRQLGLSLASAGEILRAPKSGARGILEQRLLVLAKEISRLREQQHTIIRLLGDRSLRRRIPVLDKKGWIALLRACGLDEAAMNKWHQEFEKMSPLLHQEFLEGLGIPAKEIDVIRKWSKN